ncbi:MULTISPECIES: hypothetical protein [Nocardiopsis]|jgi:MYXO-CTERM domain-containing protein|uniref:MYXO-CTERM domain-containing protein n=1 Tax=Nocardiopsis sinuspersici TaxID=501010 RepID=A0A1V3BYM7_9ACTN|nr:MULTISPECIES: hypothetical protein [Nocardiopsis]NYH54742.1 MYXO-CTERM domain-containing protein [Nocardiopsis sinuspersici]OOC53503.1 hypothetical protein NOSIN_06530 [Nocardiopsis sinuspersici]
MEGRNGNLVETGAYWLLYVVSVSGALLHWRLGNEGMAAVCAAAALFGAVLIGGRRRRTAAHR